VAVEWSGDKRSATPAGEQEKQLPRGADELRIDEPIVGTFRKPDGLARGAPKLPEFLSAPVPLRRLASGERSQTCLVKSSSIFRPGLISGTELGRQVEDTVDASDS